MKTPTELSVLERLQFFNGQRLFASDLQAMEYFDRGFRWLHNQSLHQPGVGNGYAVTGEKGDREITIEPGYAVDALGREIVLTKTHVEPVPPVACDGNGNPVAYVLTVSYPDDDDLEEAETRQGICLPQGVVRLREEPLFCWIRLDASYQPENSDLRTQMQNGMRVLLAQAEVKHCQLNQRLSTAQRRNARLSNQPYIASGDTPKGNTDWKAMGTPVGSEYIPGFYVDVDTSVGHFQTMPLYYAEVVGERLLNQATTASENWSLDWPDAFYLGCFTSIQLPKAGEERASGFRLNAFTPVFDDNGFNPRNFLDATEPNRRMAVKALRALWHIVWMGIEE